MSLFQRLFGAPSFRRHPDTFTLTREVVRTRLRELIANCIARGQHVLLLAHFLSTFEDLERTLVESRIDFEIIAQRTHADQLKSALAGHQPKVWLTLPDVLLESVNFSPSKSDQYAIAIIVAERYPLVEKDQRIERFARSLGGRVELGYFMSLEDPVLRQVINQKSIELLKQLGLGKNDLISSHMTSRAMDRMLQRISNQVDAEKPASSPEEWFALNLAEEGLGPK